MTHETPPYSPIEDYAVIGNCQTAALVGLNGSIDWWCLPHFSGPAIFAALLDQRVGGRFQIRPAGDYNVTRRYLDESAVLETTFSTPQGTVTVTDALTFPPERGLQPQCELLRAVQVVRGEVPLVIEYEPRPDYGRTRRRLSQRGVLGWALDFDRWLLLLSSDVSLELVDDGFGLRASLRLRAGERCAFSITFVEDEIGVVAPLGDAAWERLDRTTAWWKEWCARCSYDGEYREAVLRSAVTLKLLTYSLSGAVVAAPTASLPETIGGARNWDYRYCWLRDAALTLEAFLDLGFQAEGESFLEWLLHTTRLTWPELQVLYDVFGESRLPEEKLEHLHGYCGSQPVRIGNDAWNQLQLDSYGAVVVAAAAYARRGGRFDMGEARFLRGLGKAVCRKWREPDHGLWEIPGERRHYTHSKVLCWSALDCLLRLDESGHLNARRERHRFEVERTAIRSFVDHECWDPERGFVAAAGTSHADASLLLLTHYGYLRGDDPRMSRTFDHIDRELGRGKGLLLRYAPGVDGLQGEEHSFGICSFWAVSALTEIARHHEARRRFDQLLGYANDVGLYAEEIASDTGAAVGNFPQAFTHVGLVQAALALDGAPR